LPCGCSVRQRRRALHLRALPAAADHPAGTVGRRGASLPYQGGRLALRARATRLASTDMPLSGTG
jgi:hypothetical protein